MTRSLVTVVLFIALLALVPFALRRLQARRTGGVPGIAGAGSRLVSTLAVGPQQKVVTVEVGPPGARTSLVLGVTAQSISCLHVLQAPRFEMPVEGSSDV
jgi:flagellar protein FliO/FliZ